METAHKDPTNAGSDLTDLLNIIESFGPQEEAYISQAKVFAVESELMSKSIERERYPGSIFGEFGDRQIGDTFLSRNFESIGSSFGRNTFSSSKMARFKAGYIPGR